MIRNPPQFAVLLAQVRQFVRTECMPLEQEVDRSDEIPEALVQRMREMGLFGHSIPEAHGGAGLTSEELSLVNIEVSQVATTFRARFGGNTGIASESLVVDGTPQQKARYLPLLASGQLTGCFALTEPEAGSDAGGTKTKAVVKGGEWVVNGSKSFITNSGSSITSVVTVTARTGTRDNGTPEISAIMIPSGTPGFTAEQPYHKLGWHCSDTHGLSFDNVRVPEANLLGQRGKGFAQFLATLDDGRIAIAALALGCVQRMLEEATAYSKTRLAFGKPIGTYQGVSFQVADLAVMAETSRLLVYKAAWLKDEMAAGRRSMQEVKQAASIAKLYTSEAAVTATRIATQIFGGNGFMEEYPVARFYRDAKILEIGEGTSEVQRMLIARGLGLPQG